jgi:hypothetical protein
MKNGFAMLLPLFGILSIFFVQQIAVGTVPAQKEPVTVVVMDTTHLATNVAADTAEYATAEELSRLREDYRYVAKGGVKKARERGQRVTDELDSYLLRLDRQIEDKKKLVAAKEAELGALKSKPVAVVVKPPKKAVPQPSSEEDEENY